MHIHFFIQVMNYLKQVSDGGVLFESYHNLEEVLKEASKNPEKDLSKEIEHAKEQLVSELLQNDPASLGYDGYRLFEIIDHHKVFGKPAAEFVEKLISSQKRDFKSMHAELNKKIKTFNKQIAAIGRFYEIFDQVILTDMFNLSQKDEFTCGLYLYFEGAVSVRNINDLERYTRIWDSILQTFTELTAFDKQELEFGNLQNGSVILGVSTESTTLDAIMKGTIGILNSLNLITKIKKVQSEIIRLPLSTNYFELLEEEIELVLNQSATFVAEELVSEYFQGGRADMISITEKVCRSLKQILSFIEKGGKIECKTSPDQKSSEELNNSLMEAFSSLKKLEFIPEMYTENNRKPEPELAHIY